MGKSLVKIDVKYYFDACLLDREYKMEYICNHFCIDLIAHNCLMTK